MIVLGLDQANSTGYAHSISGSGTWVHKPNPKQHPGMKWLEFKKTLSSFLKQNPTDLIVYEDAHHRGKAATASGYGYIACIQMVAATHGIEVESRHSASIKKWATGKGTASKKQMVEACEKKFGYKPETDDEADAIWIMDMVVNEEKKDDS